MNAMTNTPLIEAALKTLPGWNTSSAKWAPRVDRFIVAKADMVAAVEKQHMWNVDFVAAKDLLSNAVNDALDMVQNTQLRQIFWDAREVEASSDKWEHAQVIIKAYFDVTGSLSLNQAAGRIKRITKLKLSEMDSYVEMLKEAAELGKLVEAIKPYIEKGRKPAENPTPVDMTNTATCAICGHEQKLTAAKKLVHHGFQISYMGKPLGYRSGSCFGVGHLPYEMSCEANEAYIPVLQKSIERREESLANHGAKKAESLSETKQRREGWQMIEEEITHLKGTADYERLRKGIIARLKYEIAGLKQQVEIQEARIKNWKRTPTYDERNAKA